MCLFFNVFNLTWKVLRLDLFLSIEKGMDVKRKRENGQWWMSNSIAYRCLRHIYLVKMDPVLCYNRKFLVEFKAFTVATEAAKADNPRDERTLLLTHQWMECTCEDFGAIESHVNANRSHLEQQKFHCFNCDLISCNMILCRSQQISVS